MEGFLLASTILLWVVVLVNLLLTLALIRRVNTAEPVRRSVDMQTGPAVGSQAPDFSANTLDGQQMSLDSYAGHPTALVFVGPGCQPCHELIPSLKLLAAQAKEAGAELVLVSNGPRDETEKMARDLAIELPILIAPKTENSFLTLYNISMTPSYCSLDEHGVVLGAGHPDPHDAHWQELTSGWSRQESLVERR
ncbi:TlpA family protein disulfide reductase [Ktedonosporobacter rubrisoli]|uniref:TlpA family protein disulfide reductase n=1 Tax=Ktedonosporobacter rubrisoli TaxID=2509675 RepID=A0A4P6JK02_KTERU|nr:TlpA disulfide reductase family protein [Ktedonosporobacter rubrisoli]QBD75487.1 TlpA family protein disulfide reductase [Ktedonosporobacter rubrisoli]